MTPLSGISFSVSLFLGLMDLEFTPVGPESIGLGSRVPAGVGFLQSVDGHMRVHLG